MAVTKSKTIYSEGVLPLMVSSSSLQHLSILRLTYHIQPGAFPIPFPYWHQHSFPASVSPETLSAASLGALELLLKQQTAPADTAAIIVEPVLGEGGYIPAPKAFLEGLREICDRHGIMLIADEVQSGFGRTGSWFAIDDSGVRPDILVIAKVRLDMNGEVEVTDGFRAVGSGEWVPSEWCRYAEGAF